MQEKINLITQLRKFFIKDRICMYYHGEFDDDFTDKIISIADYDISKKVKRKMAFLMTESFQNIVRHGNDELFSEKSSLFGIRGLDPYLHIFSSNLIHEADKNFLEEKLEDLNGLSPDELKAYYRAILEDGRLSEKGGAGLGLIEMAKKSQKPIQKYFKKIEEDNYAFNLQIDLLVNDELAADEVVDPLEIKKNTDLYDIVVENSIIFLFKGDFSDDIILPMLNILENNTNKSNDTTGFRVYQTSVEMIQNVARHGMNLNSKNNGVFAINKTKMGYFLSTGNYIKGNGEDIIDKVKELNAMSKEELNNKYRTVLKESIKNDENNAGVGLIDLRRIQMNDINASIESDQFGNFLTIGIEIPTS